MIAPAIPAHSQLPPRPPGGLLRLALGSTSRHQRAATRHERAATYRTRATTPLHAPGPGHD